MISCLFIAGSHSPSRAGCIELVQAKCITCHFETRVCQKLQKNKGKRSWKRTIKSMVRHGTKLSKAEQKELVQCFVTRDPKILSLCKMNK
jgi:endonuclease III